MTKYVFSPNATMLKTYCGRTPYIVGCDQDEVMVPAGTRVEIIENRHCWTRYKAEGYGWIGYNDPARPCYKVRFPGSKPGTFWTVWLGTESYPAIGVLEVDPDQKRWK